MTNQDVCKFGAVYLMYIIRDTDLAGCWSSLKQAEAKNGSYTLVRYD